MKVCKKKKIKKAAAIPTHLECCGLKAPNKMWLEIAQKMKINTSKQTGRCKSTYIQYNSEKSYSMV